MKYQIKETMPKYKNWLEKPKDSVQSNANNGTQNNYSTPQSTQHAPIPEIDVSDDQILF